MANESVTLKTILTAEDKASAVVGKARQSMVADAKNIAASFAGAYLSVQTLRYGIIESLKASAEHQKVVIQANRAFGEQTAVLGRWSEAMQRQTGITSDAILAQAGITKALSGSTEKAQLFTRAALDAGAALGRDFVQIQQQLNKSLSGMAGELGELVPEVRALTAEQLKQGEAAQLLIDKFGGAGAAEGAGLIGQYNRLSLAIGDLRQAYGDGLFAAIMGGGNQAKADSNLAKLEKLTEVSGMLAPRFGELLNMLGAVPAAFLGFGEGVNPFRVSVTPGGGGVMQGPSAAPFPNAATTGGFGGGMGPSKLDQEADAAAESLKKFNEVTQFRLELLQRFGGSDEIRGGLMGSIPLPGGSRVNVPDRSPTWTEEEIRQMELARSRAQEVGNVLNSALREAIYNSENLGEALKRAILGAIANAGINAISGGVTGALTRLFGGSSATSPTVQLDVRSTSAARELAARRGQGYR